MNFKEKLAIAFKNILNIELNDKQSEKFEKYYNLLVLWNKKFNLTAIINEDEVIEKHFADSLIFLEEFSEDSKIIDIGAGAGFPGIPLKIMKESLTLIMIDSVNKKVDFLNEVIKNLELSNTSALHVRAEDLAKNKKYRENFDICTARAVAKLNTLSEYCLPFCRLGGKMIAFKSLQAEEELFEAKNAITTLGGSFNSIQTVKLNDNIRSVIIIDKIKTTPLSYPRGQNKSRLKPL